MSRAGGAPGIDAHQPLRIGRLGAGVRTTIMLGFVTVLTISGAALVGARFVIQLHRLAAEAETTLAA